MIQPWSTRTIAAILMLFSLAFPNTGCRMSRLSKATFIDKCKGAWAGQMIGVCYGAPYEFRSNGSPIMQWTALRIAADRRRFRSFNRTYCAEELPFWISV